MENEVKVICNEILKSDAVNEPQTQPSSSCATTAANSSQHNKKKVKWTVLNSIESRNFLQGAKINVMPSPIVFKVPVVPTCKPVSSVFKVPKVPTYKPTPSVFKVPKVPTKKPIPIFKVPKGKVVNQPSTSSGPMQTRKQRQQKLLNYLNYSTLITFKKRRI